MPPVLLPPIACLFGFLCGSIPTGLWVGLLARRIDVREHGSKNLGATNVYRVLGPGLGVLTLVIDVLKGAFPVWVVPALPEMDGFPGGPTWCSALAGLGAVAGHVWTPFAGWKGGKGVATTVGVLLAMAPLAFAVFVAVFVATVGVTRYVSLGSVLGAVALVVALGWTAGPRSPSFVLGALLAAIVIVRHRENLARLLRGEERRFSLRGGTRA